MKLVAAVLLGASVAAASQHHRHQHRHADRHLGSPIERRAADVTEYVAGPTETEYVMDGVVLSDAQVEAGLAAGIYVLVSDSVDPTSAPTVSSTTAAAAPTTTSSVETSSAAPATSSSSVAAAQFIQESSSSSSSSIYVAPTTSSTYVAPSSSSVAAKVSSSSAAASTTSTAEASSTESSSSSSSSSTTSGVTSDFPSGSIKCSDFPSDYGAVALDYLGLGGWSGIQEVPDFDFGVDTSISYIVTAVSGDSCSEKSFCSYACPIGYQKSQWPTAQGSTGQSIGGLYCNTDGYLELSNTDYSTLCISGTGTISVDNKLSEDVSICRTDYPGTESETIPSLASALTTIDLTCPDASNYYEWEGSFTSAQYYINPAGAEPSEACQWGTSGSNMGNWAPVVLGVGKTDSGTFISIFQNSPTNDDGVLDYDITITGDLSGECYYSAGKFYDADGEVDTGCTVGVTGTATYVLSASSSK